MTMKYVTVALSVLQFVSAMPVVTLEDLDVADDTMSVGSYIREVRAAAPDDYHKSYQSEGDGEIGYSRKKNGGGKKGYQHFDSYHKKAGDNYEFEKQDSYGLDEEGQKGAHSHRHEQKAARYQEPQYEEEDVGEDHELDDHHEERHRKNQNKENKKKQELREGPDDGNGGKEAVGHDPADYILPEKYTYGEGNEYNFRK